MALAKGWKARKSFFFFFFFCGSLLFFTMDLVHGKKNKDYPSRDTNIDCSWLVFRLLCQSLTAFLMLSKGK
ncbi:hypothetical protein HDV63DRAFT_371524 [Trichoderma sp. SZMC 28014]